MRTVLPRGGLTGEGISRTEKCFIIVLGLLFILCLTATGTRAEIKLLGGLTHQYRAAPGSEYRGELTLYNSGEKLRSVRIYQRDYRFNAAGQSFYPEPMSLSRSNAGWIRISTGEIQLAPGREFDIPYLIKMPPDEGLNGTYWSMVMVEPLPETVEQAGNAGGGRTELGIKQRFRYGIQIVTTIGGLGEKKLIFTDPGLKFNKEERAYRFQVVLENTGTSWLTPEVWLELYNQAGELVNRFTGKKVRLYPETSARQELKLGMLQPGSYQALLIADNGDEAVFGIKYTLEIGEGQ